MRERVAGQIGYALSAAWPLLAFGSCLLALAVPAPARAAQDCEVRGRSSVVVSVKAKGAKGDGKTDDTAAIQAAITAVGGTGGTALVPKGTYMVDAESEKRLMLKSDMTLKLDDGATLKVIPNGAKHTAALTISAVSNVTVIGGTLEGDRKEHKTKSGQWGMGIRIVEDARDVTIANVTATKMWGDGFYVSSASNVRFCAVTAEGNRRQGLTIVAADGVLVLDSVFKDTRGTRPNAGIDLEPNKPDHIITNVRIENSKFLDNAGAGIILNCKHGRISKVEVARNVFRGNRPLLIANAPAEITSDFCRNRQFTKQEQIAAGFNPYATPIEIVVLQSDCENIGMEARRGKSTKPKP
ncbi:MAG: glycosyl hydrolase family 28-related protein [Methyloceanibacter sp.]|uniref:glycosyl hydrolase family 28-related protein n=1 Tax=Methyloceanibacter sp. TaxID=1965321 RepID=UPI003D9B9937